jgi:hypothetical protein
MEMVQQNTVLFETFQKGPFKIYIHQSGVVSRADGYE